MFANLGGTAIHVLLEVPHLQSGNIMVELIKRVNVKFRSIANVSHI